MKTTILTSISAVLLLLVLVVPTMAQNWELLADIPFSFNFGNSHMPGGKYTVEKYSSGLLLIRSVENRKAVFSLSNAMEQPQDLKKGKLVFNAYGDRYFLSSVSWPGGPSQMLPPGSIELLAAKESPKQKLDVASTR